MPQEAEARASPEQVSLPTTPDMEQSLDMWQQTGTFPYPELQVFPTPRPHDHSRTELLLIHRLSSLSRSLLVNGTSDLTVWASKVPRYLSVASSYPYVMHALLAFSANNLAWTSKSSDARKLQIQHGGIALHGLHDAISSFSRSNADSVLAASILLMTQANDWRTWSSLEAGIRTVTNAMDGWRHESLFAEYIVPFLKPVHEARPHVSHQERHSILSTVISSLDRLRPFLVGHDTESYWVDQLLSYVQSLIRSHPAQTVVDQFDQLYKLRKWILFVPSLLLEQPVVSGPVTLVLAHLYATALALEPLFPDLGPSFCTAISLEPLEKIIQMTAPMQMNQTFGQHGLEIGSLMQFPQQAASSYRWAQQRDDQMHMQDQSRSDSYAGPINFDMESMSYSSFGNLSPGFVPSQINAQHGRVPSDSHSPYLDVPTATQTYESSGFTYGTSEWGTAPSPGFPAQTQPIQNAEQGYEWELDAPYGGVRGGFVNTPTIWT
ncbi:hypothetical protein MBLNU459_g5682t1 [Dothideomycetes sp. NU459]